MMQKNLYRWLIECAASHKENGDDTGAEAILFAVRKGAKSAKEIYPEHVDAIANAIAYAKQEFAGGIERTK